MLDRNFKTDINKLHYVAENLGNLGRGEGETFYLCHTILGIILLAEENHVEDVMIIVLANNRAYVGHIQAILENIMYENRVPFFKGHHFDFNGLYSINNDVKIRFIKDEQDILGYDDFYLVDARYHE